MIHPHIKLGKSNISGKGLFASRSIPRGTVVWMYSESENKKYRKNELERFSPKFRKFLEKYGYGDKMGNLILNKTIARFWNHSCKPNVAPVDEKIDIAIKDIRKGEEILHDYTFLITSWEDPIKCNCGSISCRKLIKKENKGSKTVKRLEKEAKAAMKLKNRVYQPLLKKKI
jgi:SET domain-containing protein